jgi:hypothetical protein
MEVPMKQPMRPRMTIGFTAFILAIALIAAPNFALAQDNADDSMQMVTGCLQKGPGTGGFSLTDENGKLWDVHSTTIHFAAHVGHTVTLTGTIPQKSKNDGTAPDTSPQNHLNVTDLKMVSDHCSNKN